DPAVVAAIEAGLSLDPILPEEVPDLGHAVTEQGCLRILPHYWGDRGGMDGFFIARFVKPV
ncbi:MAG: rRNA cytosine-C5-methylase, partial [Hyphomonadaceae bacterium]